MMMIMTMAAMTMTGTMTEFRWTRNSAAGYARPAPCPGAGRFAGEGRAMSRHLLFTLCAVTVVTAASAAPVSPGLVRAGLEAEGYRIIDMERSLLGRWVIVMERSAERRELVLDAHTGVALRDHVDVRPLDDDPEDDEIEDDSDGDIDED